MAQFFAIHPDNPQDRLIKQAADIVRSGGVIVYPTDSCYALGLQTRRQKTQWSAFSRFAKSIKNTI